MSKKIFTLATSRCGHCRNLKNLVESKYPNLGNKYEYFVLDKMEDTDESRAVLGAAQHLNVRGVPFTVLIDNQRISKAVRGFDPAGMDILVKDLMEADSENESQNGGQMEIPFEN